jgi:hypothetical protein
MKYVKLLFAALLAVFAMAASAADLPTSFNAVTTNGTAVSISTARMASFECGGGQVTTTRVDSAQFYYIDTSGSLCAKLRAQPNFVNKWVKQQGVSRWFQAIHDSSQCYAGSTLINYNTGLTISGDGCQLDADLKAKSN